MATAIVTEPVAEKTDTMRVLDLAHDLYEQAPAHGMPDYDRFTGARTHCALSACATAGFALGLKDSILPAVKAVSQAANLRTSMAVPDWEARASTDDVLLAFDAARGTLL